MRYKLELLQPIVAESAYGSRQTEWRHVVTAWAERVKSTGRMVEEAGEHFSDYSVQFNIRDAHHPQEGWRARQLGGLLYEITNIIPNRERGMLTLCCERVNE